MSFAKRFCKKLCPFLLLFAVVPLTGCLFRSHEIRRPVSTAALKDASREQLIDFINNNAARLQSLKANVDFSLTVSKPKQGGKGNEYKVTEYTEVSGYLLVRKPEMLRMIGLVPAVRNTLFDMVSNGKTFALSIPPQSKFIVGSNQIGRPSLQPLENIRPQAIFDALLLKQIDPQNEIAVLEQGTEVVTDPKSHKELEQADYEIIVIHKEGNEWYLSRKIVFSRVNLLPDRQLIYNQQGRLVTDASYESFKDYGTVVFPETVHIARPIEGYDIQLTITKLSLNQNLTDAQFELPQPPGAKVINLDQKGANATALNGQPAEEAPKPMH
jgi:outer membrane lipoprotein-sorting protein